MSLSPKQRWCVVAVFAIAMAFVEAAVVFYLRTMVDRIEPYQPNPLPVTARLGVAELYRELATMVMLVTVGWLAGATCRGRFAFMLLAFGVWDIFYYLFLKVLTGWPHTLADWDILFLIPLPWWGPVWAPTSIALMMITFALLATILEQGEPPIWPGKTAGIIAGCGIALALYLFMAEAIRVAPQGVDALRNMLPVQFQSGVFVLALAAMAFPNLDMALQLWRRYRFLLPEPAIGFVRGRDQDQTDV